MTTLRTLSGELRRPSHALAGWPLAHSLLWVFSIAAGWAVLMRSAWVGVATAAVAVVPLWWAPQARENKALRFRITLLLGGLVAAVHLYREVMN